MITKLTLLVIPLCTILMVACFGRAEPEEDDSAATTARISSLEVELSAARTETAAVRLENSRLRAQILGYEVWEGTVQLEAVGGFTGESFLQMCPRGEALVGFVGRAGALIDSLLPVCSSLDSRLTDWPPNTTPTLTELFSVGGPDGTHYERVCDDRSVVIGLRGRAAHSVDSVSVICGTPPIIEPTPTETEPSDDDETTDDVEPEAAVRSQRTSVELESIGGQGGTPWLQECPDGWVAVGLSGRADRFLERLSLLCVEP